MGRWQVGDGGLADGSVQVGDGRLQVGRCRWVMAGGSVQMGRCRWG